MKILSNTLECDYEREEGTKEGRRVTSIPGKLVIELSDDEIQAYEESEEDLVNEVVPSRRELGFPNSVLGIRWFHELANNTLTLTVNEDELEAEIDFP